MDIEETRRKYKDIINLERPVHENDFFSAEHPKMDAMERAKIFAPFDALKGFSEAVASKETFYEKFRCVCKSCILGFFEELP